MTAVVSIVVSVILLFVWPIIFDGLVALGNGIAAMGGEMCIRDSPHADRRRNG